MALVTCSECGQEFKFTLFVPSPGRRIKCIDCTTSATQLGIWYKASKDAAEKKRVLKRIAALKLAETKRKRF